MEDSLQSQLEGIVGKSLLQGMTHEDIVETLIAGGAESMDAACAVINKVYQSWSVVEIKLSLSPQDLRNWHVRLRQKLLFKFMSDPSVQGGRTALAILDSLATLQGVAELPQVDHKAEIRVVFQDAVAPDVQS